MGCEVGVEVVGDTVGFCIGDADGEIVGRMVLRDEGGNQYYLLGKFDKIIMNEFVS